MVSSHPDLSPPISPFVQTKSSNPTDPATIPSRFPATFPATAADFGAAVLLVLGAGAVDDELEDAEEEELEEAAPELEAVEVVSVVEVVKVTMPAEAEVALAMMGVGVVNDVVSVSIAFGTEAVEAKPSVAAETAPLAAEDAPALALDALWTAAEAWTRGTTGMGTWVGIPETLVLASAAEFEATVTAALPPESPSAPTVLGTPATFEATAASSDAADWALAAA
ncbi:hypothetical protein IMSHALPRED_010256 [Imshaugia aleurites]|uniref:Uncharacterized protein n=1 Tax=Imshaugia aleurites TaxID=172621 RepID=A0A8H3G3H3_9LECA|nr:hypothetical protein IMSHALPRED_010256 [Imshaugia aleurites]